MSFSAPQGQGSTPAPSLGHDLMGYFNQHFPVASGIANAVGVHTQQQDTPQSAGIPITAASLADPNAGLIQQNAQPQQGGGLGTLLKLLMA